MHKNKVLIIGVNQTLVWNVARSLALAGDKSIVLASQAIAPLRFSNDCLKYIHWLNVAPNSEVLSLELTKQIEQVCQSEKIDSVLPADYETAILLASYHGNLIPPTPFPNAELIQLLHNKWTLTKLLEKAGLPYPKSEYIESSEALKNTQLQFPIVTKPFAKCASVGYQAHQSLDELVSRIENNQISAGFPCMAQEFVSGWDYDFCFYSIKGKIVAYCMFESKKKRCRTYVHDKRVLHIFEKILKETEFTGVGNWDLRYNPQTDEYKILELNPRFWASQIYATRAGINFPYLVANTKQLAPNTVYLANLGDAYPNLYERAISFLTRLTNRFYDKLT